MLTQYHWAESMAREAEIQKLLAFIATGVVFFWSAALSATFSRAGLQAGGVFVHRLMAAEGRGPMMHAHIGLPRGAGSSIPIARTIIGDRGSWLEICGLKSDIAPCPKSAKTGSDDLFYDLLAAAQQWRRQGYSGHGLPAL
jgi:hypothetical protein